MSNDLKTLPALRRITVAGCFAMVFVTGTTGPLAMHFFLRMGATNLHIGILGAIPTVMLVMQFLGALLANRVPHRRSWFIVLTIMGRMLCVPIAALPFIVGGYGGGMVALALVMMALSHALTNLTIPLWFSWMGDLIPKRVLSRYWGTRQLYMSLVWMLAFLGVALVLWRCQGYDEFTVFMLVTGVSVLAGVTDIALFIRVPEPENLIEPSRDTLDLMLQPLRDPRFRSVIIYYCCFIGATMMGGSFFIAFILDVLHVPTWKTTLIFAGVGIGGALVSRSWGRIADSHGSRPILIICTALKPLVTLVFLAITPALAIWVLPVVFLFDQMVNTGVNVAVNSYMLKMAPKLNRSMFVASILALGGLVGGLVSIIAGGALSATSGWRAEVAGLPVINYHVLFLVSFVCRVACIHVARGIREPQSTRTLLLVSHMTGAWPDFLEYPVGLYRRLTPWRHDDNSTDPEDPANPTKPGGAA